MSVVRINQLPEGSGSLSNDDIFVFMDNPSGGGITKKISLSEIGTIIGGGGGVATESRSLVTTVFNSTGNPVPKFSVIYISGGQGDMPTIALASASGEMTSSKTYGITSEAINNMSTGKVIVFGALTGVNTDQFNPTAPTGNVNGVTLWLSPTTPGAVTTTKPTAPNHAVPVGTIVRTHQNEGVVEVRIQNGLELEELHNVAISGISNNQILIYNSGNSLWSNRTLINNPADNRILTSSSSGTIDAEEYFRFDNVSKTTNVVSPIVDGDTGPWYIASSYGDSGSLAKAGRFVGRRFRGTEESPLPAQSGDTLVVFRGDSPNASGSVVSSGRILMRAEANAEAGYAAIPSRIEISTSSGPGISDNSLILYSTGHLYHNGYMTIDNGLSSPTPIYSLGAVSGNTAISYGADRQIQTLTLGGTAVNFTKGTGWNVANRSYDVILHITVTSTTSVAFDGAFVTDFFSTLPTFSAGTYIVLIRNFGASNIHCYYIGKKA